MRKRYLFYFSYVGTHFKSCSRQDGTPNLTSVVGTLEIALKKLSCKFNVTNVSPVALSSRTDRGVHAFQNAAHVNCESQSVADVENCLFGINNFCLKNGIPLRISSVLQVSDDFNARRFAAKRTYLYRIGVPKVDNLQNCLPISEANHCYFLRRSDFNVDALEEVVSIFPGVHDFTFFCRRPSVHLLQRSPIRRVDSFSVRPGKPRMSSLYEPLVDNFVFWDFIVEGRSFLYNQVRLMVSFALAVAIGKHTVSDVHGFLHSPGSRQRNLNIVPAYGLYLLKITYGERALDLSKRIYHDNHVQLLQMLDQYKFSLENSTKTSRK